MATKRHEKARKEKTRVVGRTDVSPVSPFRAFSCLFVAVCLSSSLAAAPPAVTYLYPAGGQRGTTVEVTAGATFEHWPVQVWTSDKALTITAGKDRGKLSI